MPSTTEMDRAFRRRDSKYEGVFFVAVRTTGIFCKPTCPARKPKPGNVEFFGSMRDALLAGYRPCKRCRPMHVNGERPQWVEQLFARVEARPGERLRDADLRALSVEPARARRYFRKHFGMTFQGYHRTRRLGLALGQLREGGDVNDIAMRHGFESSSGFRDAFARTFGTPPGRGRNLPVIAVCRLPSPLGDLLAAATADGVCLLEFVDRRGLEGQLVTLRARLGSPVVPGRSEHLDFLADELADYFSGTLTEFSVPLVTRGTPFQESVWSRLRMIPPGDTMSYEALARAVGRDGAVRAVGTANGANRIAIVIPCHRVVRKSGALGGYGGGLWRKQLLLDHERAVRCGQGTRFNPQGSDPPLGNPSNNASHRTRVASSDDAHVSA